MTCRECQTTTDAERCPKCGAREVCRTCGNLYHDGGDGFDGECPECADLTDQREHPEDYEVPDEP